MSINIDQRKQFLLKELKRIGYKPSENESLEKLSLYDLEMIVISAKSERGNKVLTYNARMEAFE
ncbi:hypothetical protein P9173_03365 [Bacillus safensis]|uniref:hypothetical protein n=1 Tax=Bacillus safensis TaxID=561879 RepID=UPI00227FF9F2|nr:hypothetical protein [Bacillus safensis]MCY7543923.1 hypothetical protein [Bacillus safensis]MCY7550411.1 hypothetical protein [Bacillus safensis]MCY7644059.1 hypothetical protein [Bacillus safensis]MCY7654503.1 hypothetical protein [Bacillus safensis]MEC3709182.1 hypothetical protein [Bacillus safensis]